MRGREVEARQVTRGRSTPPTHALPPARRPWSSACCTGAKTCIARRKEIEQLPTTCLTNRIRRKGYHAATTAIVAPTVAAAARTGSEVREKRGKGG
jgi:hypothetical protein